MGIDDVLTDIQTIKRLQDRVAALSKLKEDLLTRNRELDSQVAELKALIKDMDYERECLLLDLHYVRGELDKQLK